jgi:hypothetical protein
MKIRVVQQLENEVSVALAELPEQQTFGFEYEQLAYPPAPVKALRQRRDHIMHCRGNIERCDARYRRTV